MGLSQEQVIALLQQHGVEFQEFQHAPVMTAEAQTEALKGKNGVVTKNLFIRDKKRRQYLITALPDTKVDLKVLSARLGCGKGGLSWGSEELLAESLQVEAGCVTPLAVANPSAKHVLLLLDRKIQECGSPVFVHPIVNSASVLVSSAGLDAFLKGIGRQPIYVDLEAEPKIDRDNPPDLKQHADSIEPPPKQEEDASSSGNNASSGAPAAAAAAGAKAAAAAGAGGDKGGKKGGAAAAGSGKGKQEKVSDDAHHIRLTNVVQRTGDIVDLVAQALLGKSAAESGADAYTLRRLKADVQMELTAFKNAAFTAGYNAGKGEIIAFAMKQYA